ncbi:hypothetical protein D3C72_1401820 [compost metagenome]
MDRAHAHDAVPTRLTKGHELRARLERGQRALHERQQLTRHVRHAHAARMAMEQRALKKLLQVGHQVRHGGLRETDRVGRALRAAELGDGGKRLQMAKARPRHETRIKNSRRRSHGTGAGRNGPGGKARMLSARCTRGHGLCP